MPDTGVWLIVVGLVFVAVAACLLCSFGLDVHTHILDIRLQPGRGVVRTPGRLGYSLTVLLAALGALTAVGGLAVVMLAESTDLRAALAANRERISESATPIPTGATPALPVIIGTPAVAPIATPTRILASGEELFTLALEADEAGDSRRAAELYERAIKAGLSPTKTELSYLQIAFLELLHVDLDPENPNAIRMCGEAARSGKAAGNIDLPEHEDRLDDLGQLLQDSECDLPSCAITDCDCSDFAGQEEAQVFYSTLGGPEEDPHRLDPDGDGVVCEALP